MPCEFKSERFTFWDQNPEEISPRRVLAHLLGFWSKIAKKHQKTPTPKVPTQKIKNRKNDFLRKVSRGKFLKHRGPWGKCIGVKKKSNLRKTIFSSQNRRNHTNFLAFTGFLPVFAPFTGVFPLLGPPTAILTSAQNTHFVHSDTLNSLGFSVNSLGFSGFLFLTWCSRIS